MLIAVASSHLKRWVCNRELLKVLIRDDRTGTIFVSKLGEETKGYEDKPVGKFEPPVNQFIRFSQQILK